MRVHSDPVHHSQRSAPAHTVGIRGHALLQALGALALLGLMGAFTLPLIHTWSSRWPLAQSRGRFETDWLAARWSAPQLGSSLRLQALPTCPSINGGNGWQCGWQWVVEANGQILRETRLASGVWVTPKPGDGWRVDAWGEPLSGGASVLFQSASNASTVPELLCLNVLGRLRRVQGDAC